VPGTKNASGYCLADSTAKLLDMHSAISRGARRPVTSVVRLPVTVLTEAVMTKIQTPPIYLFHHTDSNTIRAGLAQCCRPESDGFATEITYDGRLFQRIPTGLTFWDHLSVDGNELSPVLGICLNLMEPDDAPLLRSPFCTSEPTNLTLVGKFMHDIALVPLPVGYGSDSAQAFGSQYYSDGTDVIIAIGGWTEAEYGFPLDRDAVKSVE
jgi:hypothetical protein